MRYPFSYSAVLRMLLKFIIFLEPHAFMVVEICIGKQYDSANRGYFQC